jgi:hypothetical protein
MAQASASKPAAAATPLETSSSKIEGQVAEDFAGGGTTPQSVLKPV